MPYINPKVKLLSDTQYKNITELVQENKQIEQDKAQFNSIADKYR